MKIQQLSHTVCLFAGAHLCISGVLSMVRSWYRCTCVHMCGRHMVAISISATSPWPGGVGGGTTVDALIEKAGGAP